MCGGGEEESREELLNELMRRNIDLGSCRQVHCFKSWKVYTEKVMKGEVDGEEYDEADDGTVQQRPARMDASAGKGDSFRKSKGGSFRGLRRAESDPKTGPSAGSLLENAPGRHLHVGPHMLHAEHASVLEHLSRIESSIEQAEAQRREAEASRQEHLDQRYDELQRALGQLAAHHASTLSKVDALMTERDSVSAKLDALLDAMLHHGMPPPLLPTGNAIQTALSRFSHPPLNGGLAERHDSLGCRESGASRHADDSAKYDSEGNGGLSARRDVSPANASSDGYWTLRAKERKLALDSQRAQPVAHLGLLHQVPRTQSVQLDATRVHSGSPDLAGLKNRLTTYLHKDQKQA